MTGTASSPTWATTNLHPGHPSRCPEPLACRQTHRENEGARFEHRVCNLCRGGHHDREMGSLNFKGLGHKAFRSNVHDACFPKHFWVPNNIVKYDDRTNPSIWLEDYRLACRAGGADDDLFII
jgi:hypothetical protein